MAFEWTNIWLQTSSAMNHQVVDSGADPANVLDASLPFDIKVHWEVPAAQRSLMGFGEKFQIRAFAESVGPGQEIQIGQISPAAVNGQASYDATITVPANLLKGEGEVFNGAEVSGVYLIVVVCQFIDSAGNLRPYAGVSDTTSTIMLRKP